VLIVGAGPTGLVLALWLTRFGVSIRIIDKLAAVAHQAMHDAGVTKRLADIGTEGVGSSPAELDAATREQFALYRAIVRDNPALLSGQ